MPKVSKFIPSSIMIISPFSFLRPKDVNRNHENNRATEDVMKRRKSPTRFLLGLATHLMTSCLRPKDKNRDDEDDESTGNIEHRRIPEGTGPATVVDRTVRHRYNSVSGSFSVAKKTTKLLC
jgi:hypothetical protein